MSGGDAGDLADVQLRLLLYGSSPAPAVRLQPTVELRNWEIVRVRTDESVAYFAIGVEIQDGFTRRSTPIESFDRKAQTATSASGRRYTFHDEPGANDDVMAHWLSSAAKYDIDSDCWRIATSEVLDGEGPLDPARQRHVKP